MKGDRSKENHSNHSLNLFLLIRSKWLPDRRDFSTKYYSLFFTEIAKNSILLLEFLAVIL